MQYFSVDGLWTTDPNPENRLSGTLSYTKKGLTLKLLGNFHKGWSSSEVSSYPLICGVVLKNPFGSYVTLHDCYTKSSQFHSSGLGSQTIKASLAIMGDDYNALKNFQCNYMALRFTYLQDWVGRSNFNVELLRGEQRGTVIKYIMPESTVFEADGRSYKISVESTSSGYGSLNKAEIDQRTYVLIEPIGSISSVEEIHGFSYDVLNLITFATDTSNGMDELRLSSSGSTDFAANQFAKRYYLFYDPLFRFKGEVERRFKRDMLFDLDDVFSSKINIFDRWLVFTKRFRTFSLAYFARRYREPAYIDDKLRSIISLVSLYCSAAYGPSTQAAVVSSKVRDLITTSYKPREAQILPSAAYLQRALDFPLHLERFFQEHEHITLQLFAQDRDKSISLFSSIGGNPSPEPIAKDDAAVSGQDIYNLTESLHWLLKAAILRTLGFDDVTVESLFSRNRNFLFLASQRKQGPQSSPINSG